MGGSDLVCDSDLIGNSHLGGGGNSDLADDSDLGVIHI